MSEKISVEQHFVGREDALTEFNRLFSYRRQKNALYIEAGGGLGKTWLLRKIVLANTNKSWRTVTELIDFSELKHRSVRGLRHAIADRLGASRFERFFAAEAEADEAERANRPSTAVVALRQKADDLFFEDVKASVRGREAVLLFDTFEVAYGKHVGRWFVNEFLQRATTCIVVFAGRPRGVPPHLPFNVFLLALEPFTSEETQQYFRVLGYGPERVSDEVAKGICVATGGRPILIELAIHWWLTGEVASIRDITRIQPATIEQAMVRFVLDITKPVNQVVQDMAYLRRRFSGEIIRHLLSVNGPYEGTRSRLDSYEAVRDALTGLPFVKYRHEDDVFVLHDEMQRMVAEHALNRAVGDALYESVVDGWYTQKIDDPRTEERLQRLLRSEQLGYMLDRDPQTGAVQYQRIFDEAKPEDRFNANELLWDEIYEHRQQFPDGGYTLFRQQADWHYTSGLFGQAEHLYEQMLVEYPGREELHTLARLGHSQMRQGRLQAAQATFERGLQQAESTGDLKVIGAFKWNLGQAKVNLGQWASAQELFREAIDHSSATGASDQMAAIYLLSGRLAAQLGKYDVALVDCTTAVNIALRLNDAQLLNRAYLDLAQAYRYKDEYDTAQIYYQKGLRGFEGTDGQFDWRASALQGLGTNHYRIGRKKRRVLDDYLGDVREQWQAFNRLNEAIRLCRKYELRAALPFALRRLAQVFGEVAELEALKERAGTGELPIPEAQAFAKTLEDLSRECVAWPLPEEVRWRSYLISRTPFDELDLWGKTQRLFEISYLEADNTDQYHASLEALTNAADVARRRGRREDVRRYTTRAELLKGFVYQEDLFLALMIIIGADLAYDEGRLNEALDAYCENYPIVAQQAGFGYYLLVPRLQELGERILALKPETGLHWCQKLIVCWTDLGLNQTHPELIEQIRGHYNLLRGMQGEATSK